MTERISDKRLAKFDRGFSCDKVVLLREAELLLKSLQAERAAFKEFRTLYDEIFLLYMTEEDA
jgi:hypothetical protein